MNKFPTRKNTGQAHANRRICKYFDLNILKPGLRTCIARIISLDAIKNVRTLP